MIKNHELFPSIQSLSDIAISNMLSWAGPLDLFVFSEEIKEESNANGSSLSVFISLEPKAKIR